MNGAKMKVLESKKDVKTGEMFGIPLFGGDREAVLKQLGDWLGTNNNKVRFVATVNPEHVMKAIDDPSYRQLLNNTDLNVIDGIALVWARELKKRFMIYDLRIKNKAVRLIKRLGIGFVVGVEVLQGKHANQVAPGSSLMDDVARMAAEEGLRVMFLGGWEDRARRTAKYFEKKYKGLAAAACRGEPSVDEKTVLDQIKSLNPEILFVAYGMKKQEEWIYRNLTVLEQSGVKLVMGVGRSFDYYSGDLKRAPEKWRQMGLEWLYSLIKEPKRWRRQLALPRFIYRAVRRNNG